MAQSAEKLLLERVVPIWGIPSELHSDRGTHFTGQIVKEACKICPIMQYFHCTYHPLSSGLIEMQMEQLKISWLKLQMLIPYAHLRLFHWSSSTSDPLILANIISLPLRLLQGDK